MSIFGKFNKGRKAAKAQLKKKAAEKEGDEIETVVKKTYTHVPTHAAVDALSGAPSTWKVHDRLKIKEHHKRRSQLIMSRVGSTVSQVQWSGGPNPHGHMMPRNSSYSTYAGGLHNNVAWFDRGDQVPYPHEGPAQKRYKMANRQSTSSMSGSISGHQYHDSAIGPSPLASNVQSEEVSPVVSSGNSTSSHASEPLEMPKLKPECHVYEERDIFQRLHTSTTRKLGEAPLRDSLPVTVKSPIAPVLTELKQKNKRSRWSMLGRKQPSQIAT